MLQISGGLAKGIYLKVPATIRPATERMREALFSALPLSGFSRFLDLFAGTGSYGLEALSRAHFWSQGVWVDQNKACAQAMAQNLAAVQKSIQAHPKCPDHLKQGGTWGIQTGILTQDVLTLRSSQLGRFDLIFMDPPYDQLDQMWPLLLDVVERMRDPGSHTRLVLEAPRRWVHSVPDSWQLIKSLGRSGRSDQPTLSIYGFCPEPDPS